jgi:hypothetical protein
LAADQWRSGVRRWATPFDEELGEASTRGAKNARGEPLFYSPTEWCVTAKAGKLYLTFFEEPRAAFPIPAMKSAVKRAYRLADRAPVQDENGERPHHAGNGRPDLRP